MKYGLNVDNNGKNIYFFSGEIKPALLRESCYLNLNLTQIPLQFNISKRVPGVSYRTNIVLSSDKETPSFVECDHIVAAMGPIIIQYFKMSLAVKG